MDIHGQRRHETVRTVTANHEHPQDTAAIQAHHLHPLSAHPVREEPAALAEAISTLSQEFGPVDLLSPTMPFTQTTYYHREMGTPLLRCFLSFAALVPRDRLADIKLFTNGVEKQSCTPTGARLLNIDPGLLSLENLVLATGKNFSHRIYLRDGIFAEVTLLFQNRAFTTLPWTYPDYASPEVMAILLRMRGLLAEGLKNPSTP